MKQELKKAIKHIIKEQLETADSKPTANDIDKFFKTFLKTALWAESNPDTGRSLERDYDIQDFDSDTKGVLLQDCISFIKQAWPIIKDNLEHAAHDFWLTRNGHGAGFIDGHWGDDEQELIKLSKQFKKIDLLVNTDEPEPLIYMAESCLNESISKKRIIAEEVQDPKYRDVYDKLKQVIQNRYSFRKAEDWEAALGNGMLVNKIAKLIREDPELGEKAAKNIGREYYKIAKSFLKGLSTVSDIDAELKSERSKKSSSLQEAMFWILRGIVFAIEDVAAKTDY